MNLSRMIFAAGACVALVAGFAFLAHPTVALAAATGIHLASLHGAGASSFAGLLIGMTTLAIDKQRPLELGNHNDVPAVAADIIYEGAAVGDNGSGYGRPLVAADPFRGFAEFQCDNSAGAAGDKNIRVFKRGTVVLPITGAVITDVGRAVYASDDDTFTYTAAGNSYIGRVKRYISATALAVEFDATRGALPALNKINYQTGSQNNTTTALVTSLGTAAVQDAINQTIIDRVNLLIQALSS